MITKSKIEILNKNKISKIAYEKKLDKLSNNLHEFFKNIEIMLPQSYWL